MNSKNPIDSAAGAVVAGGGLAAQRFAETLRKGGYEDPITIVCGEPHAPYDRPPLSKSFLLGEASGEQIALRDAGWYAANEVELVLGRRAAGLDVERRRLHLEGGDSLPYAKLLIATGSTPRRLPGMNRFDNVVELRTRADSQDLRGRLRKARRLAIIGAGFIGQEVASAARKLGLEVTLLEALPTPLPALGERVGGLLADLHRRNGVRVELGARVSEIHGGERAERLLLGDGREIEADAILIGIGVVPATDWLRGTPLFSPQGIATDSEGRTAVADVFAAGDVSRPIDALTGARARNEHWEAAIRGGQAAARAVLGKQSPKPLPASFWSDLYGLRIQYVGDPGGADDLVIEGEPDGSSVSARYLRAGRAVAALLVDRPRELAAARREVAAGLESLAGIRSADEAELEVETETLTMSEGGTR